ncbi:MAG: long-chain fatty acid--CoA ligase, partial [Gemmatimonadetes bacterium]|nr:long-chain fatty acid--CoA ligase [Gemmatimonadota bacterium]
MNELLPDRFFSVSRRLQSKEAIVYGPGRISYADLKGEALRVGGALAARISRGARVGLVMENSPEWVAAVYGVWAAGGAVVALNPALRGGELKRLLEHSGIECLLLDAEHPESGFLGEKMGERTHVMTIPRVGGVSGEPLSEDSISLD